MEVEFLKTWKIRSEKAVPHLEQTQIVSILALLQPSRNQVGSDRN
jgi:hypothetical protein